MSEHVLLTGGTGFVGQALLAKWLRSSDARLSLLVRSRRNEAPLQRVEKALRESTGEAPAPWMARIAVLEADVSLEMFGLNRQDYDALAGRVTRILHCAAAARFDLDIDEARRTNVGGTRNILEFGARCPGLERIDYIGTAYVAGRRAGLVLEDELDCGQEHRNTYERSKFEAELMLLEWKTRLPITVLRPSIVVCDSRTGFASDHNGVYRAMRMYLKGGVPVLPGSLTADIDLVPVDYVADATYAISRDPRTIGSCYHLTAGPGRCTTLGEIRDLASRVAGRPPFEVLPPEGFAALAARMAATLPEEGLKALKELELYIPYLLCEGVFDNRNALRDAGISPPKARDYFGKLVEFILRT